MAMGVRIATELLARIVAEAAAASGLEVCGLLFGDTDAITDVRPCRNVAADPSRIFELDPAQLLAAHRAARAGGARIVGHYHSHPSGTPEPSARDAADAPPDGALWLIVAGGEVKAWRGVPSGERHGRFDAIQLVVISAKAGTNLPSSDHARPSS